MVFILRANVAERFHMACVPKRVHVHLCVRMCAPVCAYVRVWLISGLSIHYGFSLTHCTLIPYIVVKSPEFYHVGLFIFVFICRRCGAILSEWLCDLIAIVDFHLLKGVPSCIWLGDDAL